MIGADGGLSPVDSLRLSASSDRAEAERRKVGPSGVAWKGLIRSFARVGLWMNITKCLPRTGVSLCN